MATRRAFTLSELLAVFAIIGALVAMLMPTIGMLRERANRTVCSNNMRSPTMATFAYMQDNRGFLMPGGSWNQAAYGTWMAEALATMEQYMTDNQQANSSVAAAAPFRYMHCPSNRTGMMYSYVAGQPYDHPARLERVIRCAQRWNAPGGMPVLWMDNCNNGSAGAGVDYNNSCNHKLARRGPTSGTPAGGNCTFADGSAAWLPYLGNVSTSERAYVLNGGTIGGNIGIPNCMVWIRMDRPGNLELNMPNFNLVVGRTSLDYGSVF